MKYSETVFDILYLLFVISSAFVLLYKSKSNKTLKLMGFATLILELGDSFHLVTRCLNNFITYDFVPYLGIGKLITCLTMTFFYILILVILKTACNKKYNKV